MRQLDAIQWIAKVLWRHGFQKEVPEVHTQAFNHADGTIIAEVTVPVNKEVTT